MENVKHIVKKAFLMFPAFSSILLINRKRSRGHGNLIRNEGKVLYKNRFIINGNNNTIIFRAGGALRKSNIIINGSDNIIEIGKDASAINMTIVIEDSGNSVRVGDGTKICGSTQLAAMEGTCINIGTNCLFSSEVELRTGDSHAVRNSNDERINKSKDIVIGDHVWIGHKVIILKGVELKKDTIVGIGSVVTKRFEKDCIAIAGNPAKVIKEKVSWSNMR